MIAHVGPNMPLDLLRATGRHAGQLAFDPDRPTPAADAWMEQKFAPWARSILQAWADGEYEGLAQVVFSRAEDSVQRLYYYLCELQHRGLVGGPEPLILDIAKIPRASSLARTADCLRRLAERLDVDEPQLRQSAEACNRERAGAAAPRPEKLCLLTGTPPPDRRLHAAIEVARFAPQGATLSETWAALGDPVDLGTNDVFAALALQVHKSDASPRAFVSAGESLAREIAASGAEAVILWQIEEDESQAWHLPAQRAALAAAGVPTLVMTRRDWLARDGAADEIGRFLEGIAR
jgi:hypothetical protein